MLNDHERSATHNIKVVKEQITGMIYVQKVNYLSTSISSQV